MNRKLAETRASLPVPGRRRRRRYFSSLIAATSLAGLGLSLTPIFQQAAHATTAVYDVPLSVPTHVNVNVGAVCDNHGSTVTIFGNALLGADLNEDVIFKNNVKGTQSLTLLGKIGIDITGADLNNDLIIPKQPSSGGVGGNPYISLFFTQTDKNGIETPFTDPTIPGPNSALLLGRCVQGLGFNGSAGNGAALNALSKISLAGVTCSGKGSLINVGADSSHGGEKVHILLDNNINKVVHEKDASGDATFTVVNPSNGVHKGWGAGGAGGNPLVFTQSHFTNNLTDPPTVTDGAETFHGRCHDLQA